MGLGKNFPALFLYVERVFKLFRLLFILCLIWGFNFVVMKTAAQYFSPEIFVTYRFTLGAAILLLFVYLKKLPLPPKKFWGWIFLTGFFQIALGASIVQYCFKFLDAGLVSVLNYTMPVWVTILAYFFLKEPLTKKKILGIAISIFGVAVLMNINLTGKFSAILLALSAAICWAIGNVIMKAKLSKCEAVTMTTWQMVVGAVMLAIYSAIQGDHLAYWTPISVACLLYNAVIASAFAFFLWVYILEHMQASKASISVLGVPVVGVLGGVIFLGEPLTLSIVVGMVMVLAGIILVQHS